VRCGEFDFPDPFLTTVDGVVVAYATNTAGTNVSCMTSTDLHQWSPVVDVLPALPAWASPGWTWAPSVLARPGRWILYFTARYQATGRQAIGVAMATSPTGPFIPVGERPLVYQSGEGGSIDPSPFVDAEGRAWLLWKSDGNAMRRPTFLWSAPLSPDGLALAGESQSILGLTEPWEQPVVEGPSLSRHGLFYSAGWWESPGACIGWASAPGPRGPCHKPPTGPWLASYPGAAGPAAPCPFTGPDGREYLAHHAWEPGRVGYQAGGRRALHVGELVAVDGLPRFRP